MLRYSLGSLFLALLYLSIGCAALVNASGVWPQVAITLTLAILVLFSLGAIFWIERRRVFAIGFAATGWLYFLLVFSDVTNVRPYLLTESATNQLFIALHGDQSTSIGLAYQPVMPYSGPAGVQRVVYAAPLPLVALPGPSPPGTSPPTSTPFWQTPVTLPPPSRVAIVDVQSFANIGHSLWAVIIAFAGGITAQLLAKSPKQAGVAKSDDVRPPDATPGCPRTPD